MTIILLAKSFDGFHLVALPVFLKSDLVRHYTVTNAEHQIRTCRQRMPFHVNHLLCILRAFTNLIHIHNKNVQNKNILTAGRSIRKTRIKINVGLSLSIQVHYNSTNKCPSHNLRTREPLIRFLQTAK